ncbi:putative glycosidase [Yersinia ruckeri]|nr:putative glycosidase [Yersinia ruckeri]
MLPARAISYPACYRLQPISFRDGNGDGMGDSGIEALINLQPYTQTATPSEATLLLAWRHGVQREPSECWESSMGYTGFCFRHFSSIWFT